MFVQFKVANSKVVFCKNHTKKRFTEKQVRNIIKMYALFLYSHCRLFSDVGRFYERSDKCDDGSTRSENN